MSATSGKQGVRGTGGQGEQKCVSSSEHKGWGVGIEVSGRRRPSGLRVKLCCELLDHALAYCLLHPLEHFHKEDLARHQSMRREV